MEWQQVTAATVMPALMAWASSTWSVPIPAVSASLGLGALARRSAGREAGQKGCEITTSASASSFSSTETGPSLLEVTTSVWRCDSRYCRKPSPPDTEPRRLAGVKAIDLGVGRVWPSDRKSNVEGKRV